MYLCVIIFHNHPVTPNVGNVGTGVAMTATRLAAWYVRISDGVYILLCTYGEDAVEVLENAAAWHRLRKP